MDCEVQCDNAVAAISGKERLFKVAAGGIGLTIPHIAATGFLCKFGGHR